MIYEYTPASELNHKSQIINQKFPYAFFLAAFLAAAAGLAGLVLPKEPLNIFPFFVLISPRPIK
jgi:hypothetical protein